MQAAPPREDRRTIRARSERDHFYAAHDRQRSPLITLALAAGTGLLAGCGASLNSDPADRTGRD